MGSLTLQTKKLNAKRFTKIYQDIMIEHLIRCISVHL